jgi:hypothetical protein
MPRMTDKYIKALSVLRKKSKPAHEELYQEMSDKGYIWENSQWKQGVAKSTSIFESDYGNPTGIIHIRLMAHPDDITNALTQIVPNYNVSEVSNPYPNRKGKGVRVYITATLKQANK